MVHDLTNHESRITNHGTAVARRHCFLCQRRSTPNLNVSASTPRHHSASRVEINPPLFFRRPPRRCRFPLLLAHAPALIRSRSPLKPLSILLFLSLAPTASQVDRRRAPRSQAPGASQSFFLFTIHHSPFTSHYSLLVPTGTSNSRASPSRHCEFKHLDNQRAILRRRRIRRCKKRRRELPSYVSLRAMREVLCRLADSG